MNVVIIILSLLLAAGFGASGYMKATGKRVSVKQAEHFGIQYTSYRMIGFLEIAGALGLLIGLWWWPLGIAAAAGLCLLMIGAVLTHRRVNDSAKEYGPSILLGGLALVDLILMIAR